jgi:hypothetical protein
MVDIYNHVTMKKECKIINFVQYTSHTGTDLIYLWLFCDLLPVTQFMSLAETLQ